MKPLCLLFLIVFSGGKMIFGQSVSDYVDLFIGTAGDHGQLDPSATVPFGMIKPGPDTDPGNHSGYDYDAKKIKGFSQNRVSGVGCQGAGGNLRMLPGIGNLSGKSTRINKQSEVAGPAYYCIELADGIRAELTATNQTGFHRYTFPKTDRAYVMVDISSSFAGTYSASKSVLSEHEFSVTVSAKNVCGKGRYTVYYHVWCNKGLNNLLDQGDKFFIRFNTQEQEEVLFQVTASAISNEDAKREWEEHAGAISFDEVRRNGLQAWENLLSKIEVKGEEVYKRIFYTHLYHLFLNPVRTANSRKEFRAGNGEIVSGATYTHYDCWSMWDNFRNKFSLYPILLPEVSTDIANSLAALYQYNKPRWSGFFEPAPTVRTEHTIITLLDLYRRGVTGFDLEATYPRMLTHLSNIDANTPDTRLELGYDYWALAQFAGMLNQQDDYLLFMKKSAEYKPVWKAHFLPVSKKSDIMHAEGLYEGTLWQYRWHVQFDIPGMTEMIGGKAKLGEQLAYFFDHHLYNHGNQPDIHVPFLFNFSDRPWLTQKWVNQILTKEMVQHYGTHEKWKRPYIGRIYKSEPKGYIPEMDDDEGTMSGWYVLSAMGLYPVLVGEPVFQLSTPIFTEISICLADGKKFVIKTNGLSAENFYIQSATLNGKEFKQSQITQQEILQGGILEFKVSSQPNKSWGR